MYFRLVFLLLVVSMSISVSAIAQQPVAKNDSTRHTDKIESVTFKSKLNKLIHRYFYKKTTNGSKGYKAKRIGYKKLIHKSYSTVEGKIIRHITIETFDPFSTSIADTIEVAKNFILKTGNKYHIKSKVSTIRNLLLIKENQPFDSLLVKESERLVRSNGFIRDISFFAKSPSTNSDSVDVFIRTLDRWSIIPKISLSDLKNTFDLTENNFLGLGHEFHNNLTINSNGYNLFQTSYFIPAISNTFISGTLNYQIDGNKYSNRSIAFNRPFVSPFTKWAAGLIFMQQFLTDSIQKSATQFEQLRFKSNIQDYWAGYSLKLFKGGTEFKRTTNFVSSLRFLKITYPQNPIMTSEQIKLYSNENLYLASIGISTRKYVQDKFIFKYGITEDVPIGRVYNLTGGYQNKNNINRIYLSARFSMGNYYSWGYLSTHIEYGTFLKSSLPEQGALTAGAIYFTGLFEIGKWKFRQFVKSQINIGINGLPSDSLILNEGYGLDGFKNSTVSGTRRLLLTLQTQSYSPWNIIGFRFGPFLTYSLGMLGNAETGFSKSKLYSQFGVGFLIKNENLIMNTFQLSISFYPFIPGIGDNVFRMNSFKTTDFSFRDFEIGKPSIVDLR